MKLRHALLALLACGVGFAGLIDQANARGNGRGNGRQGKMNSEKIKGAKKGFRGGEDAEGAGPLAALGLSDEQKAQIQELRAAHRAQMEEFRDSGTRPDRETMEQLREKHRGQFEAILSPEQLEQFRANRPEGERSGRRGRGFRGGMDGERPAPFASLDLNDEQRAELQSFREEMREQMQSFRESGTRPSAEEMESMREKHRAQLEAILTPEQLEQFGQFRADRPEGQRFGGRGRGWRGGMGGERPAPFGGLDLSDEQKAEIQRIRQEMREQMQSSRENGTRPSADEIKQLREQVRERIQGVLTDAQKAQLDELKGAPAASKPTTGSAIQSRSWGEVKEEMK